MTEQIPTVEELRRLSEKVRAEDWSPTAALEVGAALEIEALYFRAVELVFDAIPPERWRNA